MRDHYGSKTKSARCPLTNIKNATPKVVSTGHRPCLQVEASGTTCHRAYRKCPKTTTPILRVSSPPCAKWVYMNAEPNSIIEKLVKRYWAIDPHNKKEGMLKSMPSLFSLQAVHCRCGINAPKLSGYCPVNPFRLTSPFFSSSYLENPTYRLSFMFVTSKLSTRCAI